MIPSESSIEDYHGSFGEISVFKSLFLLPDDYYVFHSISWNSKRNKSNPKWGEADFTVINPKRGIIIIEVKSGGIIRENGLWIQVNSLTGEKYHMKDPMEQAARSKYTFIDILENTNLIYNKYYIECAVWFPSINNEDIIENLPPNYNKCNMLGKNELKNPKKSIERLFDYYNMFENANYTKQDLENTIKLLSPSFKAIPSLANDIIEQNYHFNRMTQEQSSLLDYLEEQKIAAIQGAAGTGKTMLAIEKARRTPQNEKVLFLCFNKYLLNFLREHYSKDLPYVDFYNLQSLVFNSLGPDNSIKNDAISEFLNSYTEKNWNYQHIIIDEGQDFTEEHLDLLHYISQLQDSSFYVFYDRNQLVQQKQNFNWLKSIECRLVLTLNCRNTKSIASTSNKSIGIDKVRMRREIDGIKPTFMIANDKDTILNNISDTIRKYTNNGINRSQIVILTTKTTEKSFLNGVCSIGNYSIINEINGKDILFTSARKFKGLEADVIFIIDIDETTFGDDENRRVFYVATSRAKHFLHIYSMTNNENIPNLSKSITGQLTSNSKLSIGSNLNVKII